MFIPQPYLLFLHFLWPCFSIIKLALKQTVVRIVAVSDPEDVVRFEEYFYVASNVLAVGRDDICSDNSKVFGNL